MFAVNAFATSNAEFMRRRQLERGVIMEPVVYKKPVGKIVPLSASERMRRRQIERGVIMEPVVYKKPTAPIAKPWYDSNGCGYTTAYEAMICRSRDRDNDSN